MVRFFLTLIIIFTFFFPAVSFAQGAGKDVVSLVNPIGSTKDNPQGEVNITLLVGKAIKSALGFVGAVAFAVFVVGGFMWLTSAGNSDQIKKGTDTMVWAAIGICIIFASYAILGFIITGIGAGNAGSSSPPKKETPGTYESLCQQYFSSEGLGCYKQTECQTDDTLFISGGPISGIWAGSLPEFKKKVKSEPEIKGYYISNLCGTGSTVCCVKKPAAATTGKCLNKIALKSTCASKKDPTKNNYMNSVACKDKEPKVCTWTADSNCEPSITNCGYNTKESECTDTINKQYCDWVK